MTRTINANKTGNRFLDSPISGKIRSELQRLLSGGILPISVNDSTFNIIDNGDSSKKIAFEVSGITTSTTRTFTAPDSSGVLALIEATPDDNGVAFYDSSTKSFETISTFTFDGSELLVPSVTISGDLTVSGTTTTIDTTTLTVEDKVITVNKNETGAGVQGTGEAGIEVERGTETNYNFIFRESDDTFRVGAAGSEQAVATREDSPNLNSIPFWNNGSFRFDTESTFTYSSNVLTVEDIVTGSVKADSTAGLIISNSIGSTVLTAGAGPSADITLSGDLTTSGQLSGGTLTDGTISFSSGVETGNCVWQGLLQLTTNVLVIDDTLGVRFTSDGLNTGTKRGRIDFDSNGDFNVRTSSSEALALKVNSTGDSYVVNNLSVGVSNATYQLDVFGNDSTTYSDSSVVSSIPDGVISRFLNYSDTNGTASIITIDSRNVNNVGAICYMGSLCSSTNYESTFVLGHRTGLSSYEESLRINKDNVTYIAGLGSSQNFAESTKLLVNGGISFGVVDSSSQINLPLIRQGSNSGVGQDLYIGTRSSSGQIRFFTGGTGGTGDFETVSNSLKVTIDQDGNVGIGTASPSGLLELKGSGAELIINNNGVTGDPMLRFIETTDGWNVRHNTSDNSLIFADTYGGTDRVFMAASGNLGIGTTDFGSGSGGVIGIVNSTAPSGTPTGGGVLYVESGALKYKGSSGTVTTLGNA